MAKQSNQDAQGGRVPSNVFLRESNSSKEHRIFPELSSLAGKTGTSLETNGPLASTFRCSTLLNRVTDTLFGDTLHTNMTAGAMVICNDLKMVQDDSKCPHLSASFFPLFPVLCLALLSISSYPPSLLLIFCTFVSPRENMPKSIIHFILLPTLHPSSPVILWRLYCRLLTLPWMPRWDHFGNLMRPSTGSRLTKEDSRQFLSK